MEINREYCVIRDWDHIYCQILEDILKNGELVHNRTGIDTISIDGVYFTLDLGKEFPLLETKKVVVKNAISEILWIYLMQSIDVRDLKKCGNPIWNEWMVDSDGIYRIYEPNGDYVEKEVPLKDLDGNVVCEDDKPVMVSSKVSGKTIKEAKFYGEEYAYTIGTAYGWIVDKYKRLDYVLDTLKNNPRDRRMLISLWQDAHIKTAVLPSCVWSIEFKVKDGKLNGFVHQRSADVPLGLPFNVTQYAVLLSMIAKVSGLEVGNLHWSIMDAHIYINQVDGIKTQLSRYEIMKKYVDIISKSTDEEINAMYKEMVSFRELLVDDELKKLNEEIVILELLLTKTKPELVLADKESFYDYSTEFESDREKLKTNITGNEDIKILEYKHAPFIKMPLAQ